ncbi:MAG: alpha/beta fold hydrolase [Chloroflexi bacterium]|nr:alpha/beta fold hydrolase [Chloroflexota bacterium]
MMQLPGESRYVRVNGINTHYVVAGEGRPLLLIHGLGASAATWRDNIGPLSETFRVYAVDMPGHGDSDKLGVDYSTDNIVRYLAQLTETLSIDRPAMIGHSISGALGIIAALRHPNLFSSLILVGSAGLGTEISLYVRLVTLPVLGHILENPRVGGTRFMLNNVFYDRSFASQDLLDELYRCRKMPGATRAVVRILRNTVSLRGVRKEYLLLDELKHLTLPLMVIWGAQDPIMPASHAYRASEVAPDAWVEVFDECGHWPHMEKASAFNALVTRFLSR